jgi:hypothetical protein
MIRPRQPLLGTLSETFVAWRISQPIVGTPGVTFAPRLAADRRLTAGAATRRPAPRLAYGSAVFRSDLARFASADGWV